MLNQILGEYPEVVGDTTPRLTRPRIAQFVVKAFERFTNHEQSEPRAAEMLSATPMWDEIDELHQEHRQLTKKIARREEKGKAVPGLVRRLANVEAMISIYSTAESLVDARDGTKPDIYELILALALQPELGGVNGKKFLRCISQIQNQLQENRWRGEHQDRKRLLPWKRDIKGFLESLHAGTNDVNLPYALGKLLKEAPTTIYSSSDILKLSHVRGVDHTTQRALSSALQMYELADIIKRYPLDGSLDGSRCVTFGYAGSFHTKRRWRELKIRILEQFKNQDSVLLSNLSRAKSSTLDGPANPLGSWGGVRVATRELISSGLLYCSRGKNDAVRLTLSPKYEELVREWTAVPKGQLLDKPAHEKFRRIFVASFTPATFIMESDPLSTKQKFTVSGQWQPLSGSKLTFKAETPLHNHACSKLSEVFEAKLDIRIGKSADYKTFVDALASGVAAAWAEKVKVTSAAELTPKYEGTLKRTRTKTSIAVTISPNAEECGVTLADKRPGRGKIMPLDGPWPILGEALQAIAKKLNWHIDIEVKKLADDSKLAGCVSEALKRALQLQPIQPHN